MTNTYDELTAKLKELSSGWAGYATLGSFALYAAGYLALRFHLTTLGVGTDLSVLDERYVFTGARFLIFFASLLPNVVLVSLPFLLLGWLLGRVAWLRTQGGRVAAWWAQPGRLAWLGVVIAVLLIQVLMRHCFALHNLLLADCVPAAQGLREVLFDANKAAFYFTVLTAGLLLTGSLCLAARRLAAQTAWSRAGCLLLGLLVAIQFLLLPVNYGVLIVDKSLPKVADLGGVETLKDGQEAWLVWEGKEGVTWLVRGADPCGDTPVIQRKLVTRPQKDVKKTQIIRYDALAHLLPAGPCVVP
ncbi:MAG: hypothetical protein HYR56_24015 [Acidobacteria bacterium]|nr:hypothetical protein [Acidobacteriota bacterium]MBI3423308.1 hypothetical protein [Acidobacteriota bacterium]